MWEELRHWPMVVKLRVVRALVGQTQGEFANTLATSLRSYGRYETGVSSIPHRVWQYYDTMLKDIVDEAEMVERVRRRALAGELDQLGEDARERAGSRSV